MPPMTTPGLRLVEDKPNHATEMPPSNKADALKEATITEPSSELAEGKRNHITKIPLLDQANAQEEVTITKPSREQAGGKPDHHTEMLPSDQTGAQKEATITGSPQETVDDQLKSSTPTTSDEDASGSIPAEQTAKEAVDPNSNSTLQTTKDLAGCGTVDGGGDTEDPTADSTDEKVDSEPTQKTKRGNSDKDSSRGELSDNDSQDSDDVEHEISEEEYLVHTAEGQRLCKQVAPKRIKQLGQYFRTVEYRMTFLEKELKKLRGDNLESKPKGDKDEMPEPPKVVPSIRRMNWADYKAHPQDASELGIPEVSQRSTWEGLKVRLNVQKKGETNFAKASGDQHDATAGATSKHQHHVLEVLIEDPGTKRRRQVRKHTDDENATKISGRNAKTQQKSDSITAQTSKTTLQCPERLRICSRPVLRMLHDIFEPDNPESYGSHMVFLRPFKALVLYETEIRVALINLEKKWQSKGQISSSEKTSEGKSETTDKDPAADAVVKTDSLEALEHLRLLVEFLDNDLRSTFELRKQLKAKEARPIAFADLWHLYEHGQEVRTPEKKLQIFKVARFAGGRDLLSESMPSFRDYRSVPVSCIKREESNGAFFVECYRYDFNGTQYGPVNNMFEIRRYEGLRDIKSLQVYPLRFDHDHQKERAHLVHRGEKFMALARVNETAHKTYCGLSLDEHAEEVNYHPDLLIDLAFLMNYRSSHPSSWISNLRLLKATSGVRRSVFKVHSTMIPVSCVRRQITVVSRSAAYGRSSFMIIGSTVP